MSAGGVMVDSETLKIAVEFGLQQSVCVACHLPTLFRLNERKSNIPLTCGRLACGRTANEKWATERKFT